MFAVDRRIKLLTLGAMCFALFMAMLDNTVVNVALPSIQRHLGSGVSGLQWIVDAYTLVFASLMLSGGTLGDIFGRKRFFMIGLLVFTAGSLVCGLAPSLTVLIAGRAVQGLGAAALLPGTLSILTNTFHDPRERAQAIGIWAGVSGMALALGPIVGGTLVDRFGWQSVFFLNVPIGIVALIVALRVVRESRSPEGRRLDLPGQALAIVALGSLTFALIEANSYGWTSATILGLFVTAAVALAAFWVELRSQSPMLQLKFFRNPTFAAAAACAGIISFGMFGMFFFMSLFFQSVQGYTPFQAGLRTLPASGVIVIVAPLAGRIAGRIGSKVPMAVGLAMNALALTLMTSIDATTSYSHIWPPLLLAGVGMSLVMTPMTAAVMGAVPRERAGMASATSNASREIGGVFGIALLGAIVTHIFSRDLSRAIAALHLPAAVRDAIVTQASHGAEQAAATALPAGVNGAALHAAAGASFVAGMHAAMVVAAVALAVGALAAAVFVRSGRPQEAAASPPATASSEVVAGG